MLDGIFPVRKFDFLVLDDQIRAEDTTSNLPAVLAVADVTSTLVAKEVVVIDLDSHGLAKTCSLHGYKIRRPVYGVPPVV